MLQGRYAGVVGQPATPTTRSDLKANDSRSRGHTTTNATHTAQAKSVIGHRRRSNPQIAIPDPHGLAMTV